MEMIREIVAVWSGIRAYSINDGLCTFSTGLSER